MRVSSRGIASVSKMIEQHLRPMHMMQGVEEPTRRAVYRYFRDVGDVAVDTLYLALADHLAAKGPELSPEHWINHARMVAHVLEARTPEPYSDSPTKLVNGHDLMEHFGLAPGPMVGYMLEKLDEFQAASDISSKNEVLALAGKFLQRLRERE